MEHSVRGLCQFHGIYLNLQMKPIVSAEVRRFHCLFLMIADLYRKRGLSGVGEPLLIVNKSNFAESYSLTLMTRYGACDGENVVVDLRRESNTQWDFFRLIFVLMTTNTLTQICVAEHREEIFDCWRSSDCR